MTPDPRQEWETPPDFFGWLDLRFHFTRDVCASSKNAKCEDYYSLERGEDGLELPWGFPGERAFCNPGFANVEPWLAKAHAETGRGVVSVVITHAGLATKWFRKWAPAADQIWITSPRINFIPAPGIEASSNKRDTLIWIFTPWGHVNTAPVLVPVVWS